MAAVMAREINRYVKGRMARDSPRFPEKGG